MNIRIKILIPMVILTIGCGIAVLIYSIIIFYNELDRNLHDKINVAINVLEQIINDLRTNTYVAAISMTSNPDLITAVENEDRAEIIRTSQTLGALTLFEAATILDRHGNVLVRLHDLDNYGDNSSQVSHVRSALAGETNVFVTEGSVIPLAVAAGAPIYNENMNIIGVATFVVRLDDQAFVSRMQALTGCEISIFNRTTRVATTLTTVDETLTTDTDLFRRINETVMAGGTYTARIPFAAGELLGKYVPIYNSNVNSGDVMGMLFAGYYTAEDMRKVYFFILYGVLVTMGVIFVCIIIALRVSGTIQKRNDLYIAEIDKTTAALRYTRKEAEKARRDADRANEAKSNFLANMSHEIRTPMNSVIGFSELALDDTLSDRTRDYLMKIQDNSKWLLQIINDVLDISKIESGKMDLEKVPFDMHEMFINCRTIIIQKAIEKNLLLHFYAEPSVGKIPLGDPIKLRQVLLNLLSNAVKFTNTGMIKLQAILKEQTENTITMFFEIKDSGIGMNQDQINRIFDKFIQAETGTTRKYGGTGLGLAITRNIVELMGGVLAVESMPGVGSKFSFELTFDTINEDENNRKGTRIIHSDLKKPAFKGEILLFEDNVMNQQVICEHLSRIGLKTVVAENGKAGLDIIKARMQKNEKFFDLIFMDIHMPEMDGIEAAEHILSLGIKTPIVAMTANIMSHDRELYIAKGMIDHISKPFTSQELWGCLMRYLIPITWQNEDQTQLKKSETELRQKLINNFVKSNQNRFSEIQDAINSDDVKLAHRLTHTLKTNAAQLGKVLLQQAAGNLERQLKEDKNQITAQMMTSLETELNAVLTELAHLVNEELLQIESSESIDAKAIKELIEKLKLMLKVQDTDCLNFIEKLRNIPGSDEIIEFIDDLNYEQALAAVNKLYPQEK